MAEKYNKKGFEILCITDEITGDKKKKTEDFISSNGLKTPVGYVKSAAYSTLFKGFGGQGIPFSALISPKGKLLWTGNPGNVNDKLIEDNLDGARIGSGGGGISFDAELPKSYATIAKGLAKGNVGASLTKIDKALQNARTSDDDKATLTALREEVASFFDTEMKGVEAAKGESRYYDALITLESLAKHYKGHAMGKQAKADHKAINTNKGLKSEVEVGKRIAKAQKLIDAGKTANAKKSLLIITSGFLKTTNEAKRAEKILSEL